MKGHVLRRCPRPVAEVCEKGRCDHRWAYTFSAGSDPVTGKRRQFTGGGFRTEREADSACRKAMTAAEGGSLKLKREERAEKVAQRQADEQRITVARYLLDRWLPRKAYRPNTADMHRSHIALHIAPAIGSVALADVTRRQVRDLLEAMATISEKTGKLRTAGTIARVRATLTKAFEDAVDEGLLLSNPARGVKLPETAAAGGGEMHVFTPGQLASFLGKADDDRLGPLYRLMLATGMRRGELVGLEWADVDLEAKPPRLTIRNSITQRGGELRRGKPKTKKGERQVALDVESADRLKRHSAAQAAERLAAGTGWHDEGLVFAREDGTPVRPDYVTRKMTALCKLAKVPVIRLHDGRHTHASLALAAGVDVKIVSDRLGHSTTNITQNLYQHVLPEVAGLAAQQIADLTAAAERAHAKREQTS